MDLSILIPARNEMFLQRTIEDILQHAEGDTDIIAVLDGQWADPPIQDHPRLRLIYHAQSIGQRAACNEAAKLSDARYVMKVDAHCAFDQGFDVKLLADMQPDWTMAPIMRNLHAFDWVCPNGHRRYQGPSGPCKECGEPTVMDIVWIAKTNPQSSSYCFDAEPHFQYFGEFRKRPEGKGDLTESMSLQGSCFLMERDRYFELNACDEDWGSWGSQGIEVAVKSWLSGGRVVISHKTWYAHTFRTQGGDFGFPYPLSGRQVEHAKKSARRLFFENRWPKQKYPLSWLIERFWPVPGWTDQDLARLRMTPFPHPDLLNNFVPMGEIVSPPLIGVADEATSGFSIGLGGQRVSVGAMSHSGVNESNRPLRYEHVVFVEDEIKVGGITAGGIVTDVMKDGHIGSASSIREGRNQPCVDETMDIDDIAHESDISIAKPIMSASPNPTVPDRIDRINIDAGKNSIDVISGQNKGGCEILAVSHLEPPTQVSRLESERADTREDSFIIIPRPAKGIVYYTDNRLDPAIMQACQKQLTKAAGGRRIVSVSLAPLDFGENFVLPQERGYLTMFQQILAGLEVLDTDIVFFAEHDVLYHPSHFDFIPPRRDRVYYNTNVWKVRYEDGHALYTDNCAQTSGLCAYRELLIEHYRKRIANTWVQFDRLGECRAYRNWIRRQGFEPGSHHRPERVDDLTHETWRSEVPNIDIRHDGNLTPNRWRKDQFINQRNTRGWTEAEEVPGWGKWSEVIGKSSA